MLLNFAQFRTLSENRTPFSVTVLEPVAAPSLMATTTARQSDPDDRDHRDCRRRQAGWRR